MATPATDDLALVDKLRARDEAALRALLARYYRGTVRLAGAYVRSEAVAEEVAQEVWMAVLGGIEGFEGKSSFKSWLFRIVVNAAKRRGAREARSVPLSSLEASERSDEGEPVVDPDRFASSGRWVGHWIAPPVRRPDEQLLAGEAAALVREAIDTLPDLQRQVITLCDVNGCSPDEVSEILGVTAVNQRVLLHRARSKVRAILEEKLGGPA